MKPVGHKESSLKTTKKGNVTINPKKEDLMSENLRSRILSNVESLKEAAKKKDKHIKAAKAGKRWQDSDGDGKWYEPGEDVKEQKCDSSASKTDNVADDAAKKAAKDRMKAKMMQATIDFDKKREARQ
tara:strand:+ start:7415 stop:7798 length:384 start_codon:yes stop_codon:yes gene_type:complete